MPKKILIIEDETILSEMYKEKLVQAGYDTVCAQTSQEGYEMLQKQKPDLIILDILLPKENGIFFLKRLRKNPDLAGINVLAFSNYDDPETKKEARKLGVLDYLIKTSYTPKQMVERIKTFI